jgi:hypothetical protein
MIYLCCDKRRRLLLAEENTRRNANGETPLNGIDFLEVLDQDAPSGTGNIERQNTLLVRLFEPMPSPPLNTDNVRITGGERVTPVKAKWAHPAAAIPATAAPQAERDFFAALPSADRLLVVRTDSSGDYSNYRLSLVQSANNAAPLADFDPLFSVVEFSFKVECPSDFDCAPRHRCPPELAKAPAIDYLAKDYASFRRLMLDRMSLLTPGWRERNPADLGIALVELLAYVGDRLSYQQDATATEAYLDTARRRVSVRRHARLVDYFMHDGCNARTWVQVRCEAGTAGVILPKKTALLSKVIPDRPPLAPASEQLEKALRQRPVVFETMQSLALFEEHERMQFYTWGDERCCLPKGATRATLRKNFPNLQPGDVLVFAEVFNPRTGDADDADRTRRHAVRLTEVRFLASDGTSLTDPLTGEKITEINWARGDALPFPFCVSAITAPEHGENAVSGVSEAWGNIVLADHGQTVRNESLGIVPKSQLLLRVEGGDRCQSAKPVEVPPRFQPSLKKLPVTQAVSYDATLPAAEAMSFSPADAVPEIELESQDIKGKKETWHPRRDLLNSNAADTHFVAEVERDGATRLRFGNDAQGKRPNADTEFTATHYRVGNGASGNIGAEALFHIVTSSASVTGVFNPIPAHGGTEPETMDEVRHRAPYAFQTQDRAVTEPDYAAMAERNARVQRAAATFRWTGSWHTVFVTADPFGGAIADEKDKQQFEQDVLAGLERYRMAGHDLEADEPLNVSLEIEMHVCVKPDYFRSDVQRALLEVFSNRVLPDGRRGVFHPDNFTFGQPVLLSPLYAAAQAVPGVASVHVPTFQRQGQPSLAALQTGRLLLDRLEIARCDNDPSFPEHGVFRIDLGGGK